MSNPSMSIPLQCAETCRKQLFARDLTGEQCFVIVDRWKMRVNFRIWTVSSYLELLEKLVELLKESKETNNFLKINGITPTKLHKLSRTGIRKILESCIQDPAARYFPIPVDPGCFSLLQFLGVPVKEEQEKDIPGYAVVSTAMCSTIDRTVVFDKALIVSVFETREDAKQWLKHIKSIMFSELSNSNFKSLDEFMRYDDEDPLSVESISYLASDYVRKGDDDELGEFDVQSLKYIAARTSSPSVPFIDRTGEWLEKWRELEKIAKGKK